MHEVFNTTSASDEESDGILLLLQENDVDFYIVDEGRMMSGGIYVKDKQAYKKARELIKQFYSTRKEIQKNTGSSTDGALGKPFYLLAVIIIFVLGISFINYFKFNS